MGRPSTASFTKIAGDIRQWTQRWLGTGAGASVPVKTNGKGTLARQGVGLYTMVLPEVGGRIAGVTGTTHTAATVAPQSWKYVVGSLVTATKTISLECWSAAGALADPPASALVDIEVAWLDNTVD